MLLGLFSLPSGQRNWLFQLVITWKYMGWLGFFFFFPSLGIVPSRPWVDDTLRLSWKMAETGTGNQAAGWTSGLGGHREENEGELAAPAWTFASPCAHPLAEHIYFSLLKRFFFFPPPSNS